MTATGSHHTTVSRIVYRLLSCGTSLDLRGYQWHATIAGFANANLALEADYAELPDTAFQRALEFHGACSYGRNSVGSLTLATFWEREEADDDPNCFIEWLKDEAYSDHDGAFEFWTAEVLRFS